MGLLNGNVVLVSWRGTAFGQRIILTHTYVLDGNAPAGQTIQQDLADILTGLNVAGNLDATTSYLACLPATYTCNEIRAQRIWPTRTAYESFFPVGMVGTHAGAATVACDSAGLTMRGPLAGRHYRGTKKIGPCPDGASAAGLLTNAYFVLVDTLGEKLMAAGTPVAGWAPSQIKPVLFDRVTFITTDITSRRVGAASRVMNRRVVGRGE